MHGPVHAWLKQCCAPDQDALSLAESPFLMHPVENKRVGLYHTPVAILDFASLYPSLYRAHNLCYTTLLHPDDAAAFPPEQVFTTPTGVCCKGSAVLCHPFLHALAHACMHAVQRSIAMFSDMRAHAGCTTGNHVMQQSWDPMGRGLHACSGICLNRRPCALF